MSILQHALRLRDALLPRECVFKVSTRSGQTHTGRPALAADGVLRLDTCNRLGRVGALDKNVDLLIAQDAIESIELVWL